MLSERHQNANGPVSHLEHHLRQYTLRNTSDFFIHKDLKGFLSRELDFYLKNELLNLDEIERAGEQKAERWFQKMRLIKAVGNHIIDFLGQIEIELPPPTEGERRRGQTDNPAEKAVEMIQDLLETSLAGTDEELATLTDQMHPRAVRKVAEFLKILKNNRAQVTIGLNGREVALRDAGEVERAVNRLAVQNIREETTTTTGTLIGIVPARRFFEFRVSDTNEFIEGRIGQEIHDPYRVAARYTNREVRARIRRLQVGQGQPKYTLLEMLGTVDGRESP